METLPQMPNAACFTLRIQDESSVSDSCLYSMEKEEKAVSKPAYPRNMLHLLHAKSVQYCQPGWSGRRLVRNQLLTPIFSVFKY